MAEPELLLNGNFTNGTSSWLVDTARVVPGFDGNGVDVGNEDPDMGKYGSLHQNIYPSDAESGAGVTFNVKLENDTDLLVGIAKPSLSTCGVRVFKATTGDFYVRETDSDIQFSTRELGANWFEVRFKVPSPLPVGTKFEIQGRGLVDSVSCVEVTKATDIFGFVKPYIFVITGISAAAIAGYFVYKYVKKRKTQGAYDVGTL
jgi:hypothetical protein